MTFEISARGRSCFPWSVDFLGFFMAACSKVFRKASLILMKEQVSRWAKSAVVQYVTLFRLILAKRMKHRSRKGIISGAHQMEPPSPIQALGVNPFPSRFIIRTVLRGDFTRRRWEEPITTTKWHCYCTSSNNRKFGVDRPNTIIS